MTALSERRQYAFEVAMDANKIELIKAIQKRFNVTVVSARTAVVKGKKKTQLTRRGRFEGKVADRKKIIVTLKDGDKIDLVETGA